MTLAPARQVFRNHRCSFCQLGIPKCAIGDAMNVPMRDNGRRVKGGKGHEGTKAFYDPNERRWECIGCEPSRSDVDQARAELDAQRVELGAEYGTYAWFNPGEVIAELRRAAA